MILQRSILRELLGTFLAALASLTTVIFVAMSLVQLQALKVVPVGVLKEIAPHLLPLTLSFALPVGVLIASGLVFGRLAADNEIDAIRVAGIPLTRVLAPPVLVGLIAAAGTLWLNERLVPRSHFARRSVAPRGFQEAFYGLSREATSISFGTVALAWRGRRDDAFLDFQVRRMDPKTGLVRMEARAAEGRIYRDPSGEELWVDLVDGTLVEYTDPTRRDAINQGAFRDYREVIDLGSLSEEYSTRVNDMTSGEIEEAIASGGRPFGKARLWTELSKRRALSVAPVLFALVGAPLGILVRKGSRIAGLGWSVIPFTVYYPLMIAAEAFAARGRVDPTVALWAPDAVMALGASLLLSAVLRK